MANKIKRIKKDQNGQKGSKFKNQIVQKRSNCPKIQMTKKNSKWSKMIKMAQKDHNGQQKYQKWPKTIQNV